jgi:hypothetical protein
VIISLYYMAAASRYRHALYSTLMVLVHEVTAVIDSSWGAAGTRFEQVHEVIMSMHAAANAGVH